MGVPYVLKIDIKPVIIGPSSTIDGVSPPFPWQVFPVAGLPVLSAWPVNLGGVLDASSELGAESVQDLQTCPQPVPSVPWTGPRGWANPDLPDHRSVTS